ncbi:MAG: galactose mutarotase, partial [Marinilabiliales bacterium]|nr:galactose mutarotase [Marinilabiliales bacterium]
YTLYIMKVKYLIGLLLLIGCTAKEVPPTINAKLFNKVLDGKQIQLFTLRNNNNMEINVTNYGARIVSWLVPDKNGKLEDVVLGHDSIDSYLNSSENYFGASIGRYGNRIAKGEFSIGDIQYKLAQNNGINHLHGGIKGFSAKVWDAELKLPNELIFHLTSADMDEGYPGELKVLMTYTLTNDNELVIEYEATCDKSTVINLTNHSYFNLHGAGNGTILDHQLTLNSDAITPVDSTLIPTGVILPVENTPYDFRKATAIGDRIDAKDQQIHFGGGYDINYVLRKESSPFTTPAASVYEPVSGRLLEVFTDQPGIQFYSGNFLTGKYPGKKGKMYPYRSGFCLETQHYPNSPNIKDFPSVQLDPGQTYTHKCIYKFSVK